MVLRLLIDAVHDDETRVVIADNTRVQDFDFVTAAKKQLKGNIYLAKITRVEPSLQAAFVEYGGGKQGFLPFAEIHPDYYQIPMADRQRLLEEVERAAEREEERENAASLPENPDYPATDAAAVNASAASHIPPSEFTPEATPVLTENILSDAPAFAEPPYETQTHAPAAEQEAYPRPITELFTTPANYADLDYTEAFPDAQAPEVLATHTETLPGDMPFDSQPGEPASGESVEQSTEIETLASDEEAVHQSRPATFHRRYKIQEVIKRNQIVLVQVIKEERGNKGVSLTTFISLAGRYCVLMPNSPKGGGISRKIMSGEHRRRLKEISAELKTSRGMSAIIRTAGIDRTGAEIKRDYEYLVKLWDTIREQTLSSTAPALIYEEGDLIKRTIRDLYSTDIEEIIVEGEAGFNQAKDFLKMILASHAPKVKLYQENIPLFYAYGIEDQLNSMYDPIVKLRSGGYIVIDPTEALISIDVNSGRSTGERNIEETATKTNLEAVQEIARQLRLRDLAGLIVIDLIDMMDSRNRRNVERALKDALKLDRAKIQIGRISPFGLMEMSRQRLRPSISESSTMACPHCLGRGIIRSDASIAIQVIRAMEKEAASGQFSELKLTVTPSAALFLLNAQRDAISALEQKYTIRVTILTDTTLAQGNFRLEKVKSTAPKRTNGNAAVTHDSVSLDQKIMDELSPLEETSESTMSEFVTHANAGSVESATASPDERPRRRGRRGGRGRNNRPFNDRDNSASEGEVAEAGATGESRPPREPREPREQREPREASERGGRNRRPRRWRDKREGQAAGNGAQTANDTAGAGNVVQYQQSEPKTHSYQPRSSQHSGTGAVPSLHEQASPDSKPKKGWWRRIVES